MSGMKRVWAHVRRQPIALLALFVALGGTSYAASGPRGDGGPAGAVAAATVRGERMYACVTARFKTLNLTTANGRCKAGERKVSWLIDGAAADGRRGPTGRRGPRGAAGERGADGARGETGARGERGEAGAPGARGEAGPQGERGAQGQQGATGAQGPAGSADQTTLDAIDARLDQLETDNTALRNEVLALSADNDALTDQVNDLTTDVNSLTAYVGFGGGSSATLTQELAQLQASFGQLAFEHEELADTFRGVTRDDDTLQFSGMNLQLLNGAGSTATTNGLGNLIVGYNSFVHGAQTGSHDVVIGEGHTFTSWGGLVAGQNNAITGPFAAVVGGAGNLASGESATVLGGSGNGARGLLTSVFGASGVQLTSDGLFYPGD